MYVCSSLPHWTFPFRSRMAKSCCSYGGWVSTHFALRNIHTMILMEESYLPLVQCQNKLWVYIDTSLSFNKHSDYEEERVSNRKETLLTTYKAVERSIIKYAEPVWSPNLRDINYSNIQYAQNEALLVVTKCQVSITCTQRLESWR